MIPEWGKLHCCARNRLVCTQPMTGYLVLRWDKRVAVTAPVKWHKPCQNIGITGMVL